MYVVGDKQLSNKEAEDFAADFDIDVQTLAQQNGWEYIEDEGKPTDPPKKTPTVGPEPLTPAGDSSSGDISLESQGPEKKRESTGFPGVDLQLKDEDKKLSKPAIAREILDARAAVKPEDLKAPIAKEFFNLEQLEDGSFAIKTTAIISGEAAPGEIIGFSQYGGPDDRRLNEAGLLAELGQTKYDLFMRLSEGSLTLSAEQIENLNLEDVPASTIDNVISTERQKAGERIAKEYDQATIDALEADMPTAEQIESNFATIEQEAELLNVGKAYLDKELEDFNATKKDVENRAKELKDFADRKLEILEGIAVVPGADMSVYNEVYASYKDAVNQYNSFIASEEVAVVGDMAKRLTQATDLYNERLTTNAALLNQTIEDSVLQSTLVKDYTTLGRLGFALEEGILGTMASVMGLGTDFINYLSSDKEISEALDNFKARTTQYTVNLEEKRIKEMPLPETYGDVESGKIGFFDYTGDVLLNNSATILTVVLPTGVAAQGTKFATRAATVAVRNEAKKQALKTAARLSGSLFFVMETGGSLQSIDASKREAKLVDPVTGLTEMEQLQDKLNKGEFEGRAEKSAIEERINSLSAALNVTEIERAFVSITKGGIATTAEMFGSLQSVQNVGKWMKTMKRPAALKNLNPVIAKWAGKTAGVLRGVGQVAGMETIEETLTLMGHNLSDIQFLDMDKSVVEGLDKDFLGNVILPTLAISGPGAAGNVGHSLSAMYRTKQATKRNGERISRIMGVQDKLESANMSEYDRQKLEQEKIDLLNELNLEEANVLLNASQLEAQDLEELSSLQVELNKLLRKALVLGEGDITTETRQELAEIQAQVDDVVNKKEELLRKPEEEVREKVKEAKNQAEAFMLLSAFSRNQVLGKASRGNNFVEITSEEDLNEFLETASEEVKQEVLAARSNQQFGVNVGGYSITFNDFVEEVILKIGGDAGRVASVVGVHEVGHDAIEEAGGISDAAAAKLGDALIQDVIETLEAKAEIGTISGEDLNNFKSRLEEYKKTVSSKSILVNELMMIINEMKASGVLSKSDFQAIGSAKAFLNRVLNKVMPGKRMFIPMKNYEDVSAFLDKFQNRYYQGKKIQTAPPEEALASVSTLNEAQRAEVGEMLTKRKARIAQSEAIAKEMGIEPVADPLNQRTESRVKETLKPLIDKQITKYTKSLYDPIAADAKKGVSREDFQNSLETEILNMVFNEYDAAKQDIEKFVVARTGRRVQDLASRLGIESVEAGIKKDVDTAKNIEVEEAAAPQQEKEGYRNLIQRRVLDTESIDRIKDKLKSTLRTMKTRMDEAVSKNVTVKPYIAEIKKSMGKQADIDFKKAIGGLKDGEMRKYLLRNKSAILENMTTTWLMTAAPNAIQKQVNGAWTSDWKGKKIDREKVTTANAGRTSGAEIVRRLPKAGTRMSDADFLSNFFNEDGSLIRGRKESLAKAMAEEMAFDIFAEELKDPNSDIRKAFETQQKEILAAVLTENYVTEVKRDLERGTAKASIGLTDAQLTEFLSKSGEFYKMLEDAAGSQKFNTPMVAGVMKALYIDKYESQVLSEKDLESFARRIVTKLANDYFFKESADFKEKLGDVRFEDFLEEGISSAFAEDIAGRIGVKLQRGELKGKSQNKEVQRRQRILSFGFNEKLVREKGEAGLMIILRHLTGHQTSSGQRGKRYQYYKGMQDFIRTNLNQITDSNGNKLVEISYKFNAAGGVMITSVKYKGKEVEGWKAKRKTQSQSPSNKKELYTGDNAVKRQEEAKEAKELLIDYLKYVKENGNAIDWLLTMMSLKSNMQSMLKSAAPVKYFYTGPVVQELVFEHMIPTEEMARYLTDSIWNNDKDIDLDALFDEYNVAIVPKGMDESTNILWTSAMPSWWDYNVHSSAARYYNKLALGFKNHRGMEVLWGPNEGKIIGEEWVRFSNNVNAENLAAAQEQIKEIEKEPAQKRLNAKASLGLSEEFNNILERKTGVASFKTFSAVQAEIRGRKKGKFKFFVAPNVDDFRGLVNYAFAGKGKQGEKDKAWLEEKLMTPYAKGTSAIDGIRQQIKRDFRATVKMFPKQYRKLNKQIPGSNFTYDQAVRTYLWGKAGITKLPGLSQKDAKILQDAIKDNPDLIEFAEAMLVVARRDQWMEPSEHWVAGTVLSDLNGMTEKIGRKKYLAEFVENAEIIFSKENLNKIEAEFGKNHREAIEDALYSMINGTNRTSGSQNKVVNAWLNWLNGSTGAIMFFNRRSSLLQMLSFTNFINWSDNNPVKAAAAFANQKQYWSDWAMIFNSDKLKERRGGLKQDVSADEIASVANQSKNSPQAIIAKLLRVGFTPTQIADSMAIATGGAMFYRNRVNTYLKQGMDQKAAEEQAFIDFSKKSDEAQQSSDPALVSQLQRSVLGRLVFAFQNTPMQYTRLMKKAALDLANGRGDWKENVSKIAYYGVIQNFIFSALQSALFAMLPGFDDDEDEELSDAELDKLSQKEEAKIVRVLNSMVDTILKGSGVYGAVVSTIKNVIMEYDKQEKKGFLGDHAYTILAMFNVSPPIGSKARKIYSAIQTRRFDKDEIAARGWGITADGQLNLGPNWSILGNVLSATANIPLDRVVDELTSISEAFDTRNKAWQRIALGAGWKTWDVGAKDEEGEAIKEAAKKKRKEEGIEKGKVTRATKKKSKEFKEASDF